MRTFSKLYIPTSHDALLASQKALLSHFVRTPIRYHQANLPSGRLNYIELRKKRVDGKVPTKESTLVLMHGLGSGLGFFYANYDDLLETYDRIYAVDWLGMGGSARPTFPKRSFLSDVANKLPLPASIKETFVSKEEVQRSTDFFIDSLGKPSAN